MTSRDDRKSVDEAATAFLETQPTRLWVDEKAEPVKLDLPDWFSKDQRYQRVERIGEGGMGEVWACEDGRIGRRVAMKTVHPRLASNQDITSRFVREALVQGRWSTVDWFDSDGRRYVLSIPNAPHVIDPRGLTEQETQVVWYVVHGLMSKMIGYHLGVSKGRVSALLSSAMRKLSVQTRAQLIKKLKDLEAIAGL